MEKGPLGRLAEFFVPSKRTEERGFSFMTHEGAQAVANLGRLATGEVTLADLDDDRYGVESDGTLRLDIDEATYELLMRGARD